MQEGKVYELRELKDRAPELFGIPTGTGLDRMFYKIEIKRGKPKKVPLGGIPARAVLNLTGVPDTGKSLLVEQFALTQAGSGYRVLYVSTESPAPFLYTSLKTKAEAMGLDFQKAERNIFVIDASSDPELREIPRALLDTMEYAIKEKDIKNTVIDSITALYEHKEMMARSIVRIIFNFLKSHGQTAMVVSQKRSSQAAESAEAAGGLAVAHIVDGTIVLDKKLIETKWDTAYYGLAAGSVLRTIRIDGCRVAPHDTQTWVFEITDEGLIDIKEPLSEFLAKRR
ncbi:MAG: KaiC domain-containing protein [Nitrospirae bacterium]|nr:MAG: KaiC domain-containing protein [Nitrospirota bacterium]